MGFVRWRYIFALMASTGIMLVYMLRVNISVALVSMVNSTVFKPKNITPECSSGDTIPTNSTGNFYWTEEEQGLLLGSFYWGYIILQIPCGIISLYYNAKWIYAISTLITVFLTILTPLAAYSGLYSIIALRFFMGLFEGPTYPALYNLAGKWVLESEGSIIMTLITAGSAVGTILGQSLAGVIADTIGWEWIFYIMGAIGGIWFIFFVLLTSRSPRDHWFISQYEKDVLIENIIANHETHKINRQKIPWLKVFSCKPFFALLSVNVTFNFTWYSMINCLPYYIGEVLGFSLSQNGAVSSAPYIAYFASSIASGIFIEYLRRKELMSKTKLRKLFICSGLLLAAIVQSCIIFTGCNVELAVLLVCVTLTILGVVNSSTCINYIDIAPTMSGSILSVINCCGTMSGIVAPYIKSYFTKTGETRANWANVFTTSSTLLLIGSVLYLLMGSGSVQTWSIKDVDVEEVLEDFSETDPIIT